jgi:hypothetical protein
MTHQLKDFSEMFLWRRASATNCRDDLRGAVVDGFRFPVPVLQAGRSRAAGSDGEVRQQVKLAFMDFPLREIHPRAQAAAEAARCANEQGKFWEYHDLLYADQTRLDTSGLIASARGLGMNEKAFQSCLDSGKFKANIDANLAQGQSVGVAGTPAFSSMACS